MHMWHEIYVHVIPHLLYLQHLSMALMVFNQEQFFGFFLCLGKQYQSRVLKWVFVWWFISFTGIEIIHQLLNRLYALFLVIGYWWFVIIQCFFKSVSNLLYSLLIQMSFINARLVHHLFSSNLSENPDIFTSTRAFLIYQIGWLASPDRPSGAFPVVWTKNWRVWPDASVSVKKKLD